MKLPDTLDLATEDLLRFSHELPRLLRAIRDAMPGQPGAASYDTPVVRGHTTVIDEQGTPMPSVSDPTGEAAVELAGGRHPAVADLHQLNRRIRAVAQHADALVRIANTWKARPPTDKERRDTDLDNDELRAGCEVHARAGLYARRECVAEIVDGWMLPRPMGLCSVCRSRIKRTHRLPTVEDVQAYVERGKWPLMFETSYRGKAS